jgi:hypothetical protein
VYLIRLASSARKEEERMSRLLRTGQRLYLAPRAAIGVTIAAVLGLAAVLIVIQVLLVVVRRIGS